MDLLSLYDLANAVVEKVLGLARVLCIKRVDALLTNSEPARQRIG